MTTTLLQYSQEIQPNIRSLLKKQEILKEWATDDAEVIKRKQEIKDLQDSLKQYIEETESDLVREIKDLTNDIKLACQAAAKGSNYKAAELKSFFTARAKEKVDDVVDKGTLFADLKLELA